MIAAAERKHPSSRARVQFCRSDEDLSARIADFLSRGLRAGDPMVFIATAPRRRSIHGLLRERGHRCEDLERRGQIVLLDAQLTVRQCMAHGSPDAGLFRLIVGSTLELLAESGSVRAYGEMVDVLWRDGQRAEALRIEELWNDLPARVHRAHSIGRFYKELMPGSEQGAREAIPEPRLLEDVIRLRNAEITERAAFEAAPRDRIDDLRGQLARAQPSLEDESSGIRPAPRRAPS